MEEIFQYIKNNTLKIKINEESCQVSDYGQESHIVQASCPKSKFTGKYFYFIKKIYLGDLQLK